MGKAPSTGMSFLEKDFHNHNLFFILFLVYSTLKDSMVSIMVFSVFWSTPFWLQILKTAYEVLTILLQTNIF